ncbi:MAG: J domain-containing protein [Acidobacteriota bacterium]|nr:J domain-containing protein [Acidobacteriota bacterium]
MLRREARDILGLPVTFGPAELDEAFRRQARVRHPDAGGDPAAFVELLEAHRVLSRHPSAGSNVVVVQSRGHLKRLADRLHRRLTGPPRVH